MVYRFGKLKLEVHIGVSFHHVLGCQEPLTTVMLGFLLSCFVFSFFSLNVYENEK